MARRKTLIIVLSEASFLYNFRFSSACLYPDLEWVETTVEANVWRTPYAVGCLESTFDTACQLLWFVRCAL